MTMPLNHWSIERLLLLQHLTLGHACHSANTTTQRYILRCDLTPGRAQSCTRIFHIAVMSAARLSRHYQVSGRVRPRARPWPWQHTMTKRHAHRRRRRHIRQVIAVYDRGSCTENGLCCFSAPTNRRFFPAAVQFDRRLVLDVVVRRGRFIAARLVLLRLQALVDREGHVCLLLMAVMVAGCCLGCCRDKLFFVVGQVVGGQARRTRRAHWRVDRAAALVARLRLRLLELVNRLVVLWQLIELADRVGVQVGVRRWWEEVAAAVAAQFEVGCAKIRGRVWPCVEQVSA